MPEEKENSKHLHGHLNVWAQIWDTIPEKGGLTLDLSPECSRVNTTNLDLDLD